MRIHLFLHLVGSFGLLPRVEPWHLIRDGHTWSNRFMAHKVAAEAPGPREDNGGKFDLQDAVAKLDGEGDNQPGTGDMRMEYLHAHG